MPTISSWDDPACPLPVDYSLEAFDEIRRAAVDGLLALPRVGMGVGGLLLGVRRNGRITVLDSVPIECSHTYGPAFRLTPEETAMAGELAAAASPLSVVGWYCSKTRGPAALNEQDLALYKRLCPEGWHLALLLMPHTAEPSRAAICSRRGDQVIRGADRLLPPFHPEGAEAEIEVEPPAPVPVSMPVSMPVPVPAPERKTAAPPVAEPAPAARAVRAPEVAPPRFTRTPPPRPSIFQRAGCTVLVAALAAGAGASYATRNQWMPRPPLRLDASASGGTITFRWNPDSLRGIDAAALLLDDGEQRRTIHLDGARLRSGNYRYEGKSSRVGATLRVGAADTPATFRE